MSHGGIGAWTSWALMEAVPVKPAQQAGVTLIRIPTAPAGDTVDFLREPPLLVIIYLLPSR